MGGHDEDPRKFLPLTPAVLEILLALAEEDLHGYAIMREVERRTDGETRLGPGTLYRSVGQLLERGWIREADERPDPELDDERRRYYRLTDLGRGAAMAEVERLEGLVRTAHRKGLASARRPRTAQGEAS
jgi:DNA-binding PadR family transcriptional regulator